MISSSIHLEASELPNEGSPVGPILRRGLVGFWVPRHQSIDRKCCAPVRFIMQNQTRGRPRSAVRRCSCILGPHAAAWAGDIAPRASEALSGLSTGSVQILRTPRRRATQDLRIQGEQGSAVSSPAASRTAFEVVLVAGRRIAMTQSPKEVTRWVTRKVKAALRLGYPTNATAAETDIPVHSHESVPEPSL